MSVRPSALALTPLLLFLALFFGAGFVRNAVVGTSDDNPVCAADCDIDTPE